VTGLIQSSVSHGCCCCCLASVLICVS